MAVTAGTRQDDGSVEVAVAFPADGGSAVVKMVQPYGEDGIWIAQVGIEKFCKSLEMGMKTWYPTMIQSDRKCTGTVSGRKAEGRQTYDLCK